MPAFTMQDPRSWYQKRIWRKRRAAHLRLFPICKFCEQRGIVTPATVADHVKPHKGEWNEFRLAELQSLCASCHSKLKQRLERHGYSDDVDPVSGLPFDPAHPFNR
jgi:5-methylcytosine-specific restriction enzyme A